MKYFTFKGCLLLLLSGFCTINLSAQLAPPITTLPSCAAAAGPLQPGDPAEWAEVVISEVIVDAGQSDGTNDALIELAGPASTDIGGWVVTNGEWAIILPDATVIPPDGVFSIGCSIANEGSFTTSRSGLTCTDCDFAGMPLDFDVCNPSYFGVFVSTSINTYGFTLDNSACDDNGDGDQVLLFRSDGTPHDGTYWGRSDNIPAGGMTVGGGASGDCGPPSDHISVQDGGYYLLGDNDQNGIVNDAIVLRLGRKADGGNTTAVIEMPPGNADDNNNGTPDGLESCFAMPPLNDPSGIWVYAGCSPTSCNSSYMRIAGSNGNHCVGADDNRAYALAPSHMDDGPRNVNASLNSALNVGQLNAACALDADWSNNSAGGGGIPSSLNAVGAGSQWGYSDHPNPGQPNDVNSWDFTLAFTSTTGTENITETKLGNGLVELFVCEGGTIDFELMVYNYQLVEPTLLSDGTFYSVNPGTKAGSFVSVNGLASSWQTYQAASSEAATDPSNVGGAPAMPLLQPSANDGVTTLTFNQAVATGTTEFVLVWNDFGGLGSGATGTVEGRAKDGISSSQHECYENLVVRITVAEPLAYDCNSDGVDDGTPGTPCTIDCSTNSPEPGNININDYISGGSGNLSYTLSDDAGELADRINTTGIFNLEDNINAGPYTITVNDLSGCSAALVITLADNCEEPPVCPANVVNTGSTPNGMVCPGDVITLCISGDALPANGEICWYAVGAAGATPDPENDQLLACTPILTSPPPMGGPVINEVLYDPDVNDGAGGEYIEIAGTPGTDLSCFILTDGDDEIVIPNGTLIPADGFLVLAGASTVEGPVSEVDIDLDNCNCFSDPGDLEFTNSSEFVYLYDATGGFVDGLFYGASSASSDNDPNTNMIEAVGSALYAGAGCPAGPTSVTTSGHKAGPDIGDIAANGESITRSPDVTGGFVDSGNSGIGANTMGASNDGGGPAQMCVDITLGASFCSGDIFINSLINGAPASCPVSSVTGIESAFNMTCPEAALVVDNPNQCLSDLVDPIFTVTGSMGNGPTYNVDIDTDGDLTTSELTLVTDNSGVLMVNYSDLSPLLGSVFSEAEVAVISIMDNGGSNCRKPLDLAFTITVGPDPTAMLTSATDIMDCDETNGSIGAGQVMISLGSTLGGYTGPWEFEYSINGGSPITAAAGNSPHTLFTETAGTYTLISVSTPGGCMGTVGNNSVEVNFDASLDPAEATSSTEIFCNDGTVTVDLTTEVVFLPNPAPALVSFYLNDPTNQGPAFLMNNVITDPTTFVIPSSSTGETLFFRYDDPNTGCEIIGSFGVLAGEAGCCEVMVTAGNDASFCASNTINLASLGASFSGADSATWSTQGDGVFDGATPTGAFGTVTSYQPGSGDLQARRFTLVLTTNDANCPAEMDEVVITLLPVDCGSFPWGGN